MDESLKERILSLRYQPTTIGNMMIDPEGGYCSYEAAQILRAENTKLQDRVKKTEALLDTWLWETLNQREDHADMRKLTQEYFKSCQYEANAAQNV